MVDHHKKSPVRVLSQDSKIPEENSKFRPSLKYGSSTSKAALEVPTNRRASSCFFADEVNSAKSYAKACEQRKRKLLEMSERNMKEKETTEGVHDFIKHVSDIIEKKSPFKETAVCSWPKGNKKNAVSPVIDSIQFNGVGRNVQEKEKKEMENEIAANEFCENLDRKLKVREKLISSLKRDSASLRGKLCRQKSSLKKKEKRDKKHEKDTSLGSSRIDPKTVRSIGTGNDEMNITFSMVPVTQEKPATHLPKEVKRRRPSEIPLRKVRTDSSSRPKPRFAKHFLWEKDSSEAERSLPVDLSSGDKSSEQTEKEKFDDRWQLAIDVDLSCEKISIIGQEIPLPESSKLEERNDSEKLDFICGSSEILELSSFPSKEVLEKKHSSTARKKTKAMDIEKVKTSSFTVLKGSNTALNRLESLHKKNVLSKEKSEKGPSQKPSPTKSSFSLLKGKSSKRSFFSRLSSKGNKPGLKTTFKRTKKEPYQEQENARKLKKSLKAKVGLLLCDGKEVEKDADSVSREQKRENHKKESLKMHKIKKDEDQQSRVKSGKEKSSSRWKERFEILEINSVALESDSENQKPNTWERSKSLRNMKVLQKTSEETLMVCEEGVEKDLINPPPTPESDSWKIKRGKQVEEAEVGEDEEPETQIEAEEEENDDEDRREEDGWSSKTVIFDDKFNYDNYSWNVKQSELEEKIIPNRMEPEEAAPQDIAEKLKRLLLMIKGTPLNIKKDETPEKPEKSDSPVVKKRLRIDLRSANQILEQTPEEKSDVTYERQSHDKISPRSAEKQDSREVNSKDRNRSSRGCSREDTNQPRSLNSSRQKPRQSCSSLKRKSGPRAAGNAKGGKKKKMWADEGERPSPSSTSFFNSDKPLQNKIKPDTKMRSGLTKSSKREEKSVVFEDVAAIKLKRRNSEPNSFRGYVWKCADVTAKDHKASVSSMTSSLRHLNTDEIDDFILWEAVPQKMTSSWEMSLYHFKRPWSVLSCSVFRDNRESSTPGLILENLRSGRTLGTRRFAVNQNERVACHKENAFDVEPSIAQKNIDIRNWLAALNFPTPPSTSTDAFSEGNFTTQVEIDGQNLNKAQMSPKRRKVLPNLKFSEEGSKKKPEGCDIYRKSSKWNEEVLTDLVRKKSGGFVTSEQWTQRPNVNGNLCIYSRSNEEPVLVEPDSRTAVCEPRKYKSVDMEGELEVPISATIINSVAVAGVQMVEENETKEKLPQETLTDRENDKGKIMKQETRPVHSEINFWKYLFLMMLFIIVGHYCYINSYVYRN